MNLVSLQTKTKKTYEKSLKHLEKKISKCKKGSFILAPELALSDYSYDDIKNSAKFTKKAIKRFEKLSKNKTISLTMTNEKEGKFFNTFYIFHKGKIKHTQSKVELFNMNDESTYFTKGKKSKIKLFKIENLKIGTLICFELRFVEYWQKLRGADIILVPALWGKNRKDHYESLCKALAIANQCFVIASDSSNKLCAKGSSIITPFGKVYKDDNKTIISKEIDIIEIKKMRKYLNVGIK